MGTFLFQQFPCLAFTSQWPIQQQVMPWHIQSEPITQGCAGTSWIMKHSTETTHGRQDDLRWGGGHTATRCGTCTGARKWPGGGGPLTPVIRGCGGCCFSCHVKKTEQIRLGMPILRCFLLFFLDWILCTVPAGQRGSRLWAATEELTTNTTHHTKQMKGGRMVAKKKKMKRLVPVPTFPVCCIDKGGKKKGGGIKRSPTTSTTSPRGEQHKTDLNTQRRLLRIASSLLTAGPVNTQVAIAGAR